MKRKKSKFFSRTLLYKFKTFDRELISRNQASSYRKKMSLKIKINQYKLHSFGYFGLSQF